MILAAVSLYMPDYVPENWQVFLLSVAIMLSHIVLSSLPTLWIARFNFVGTTVNMLFLCAIIIVIPAACETTPKFRSNKFAWGIENHTDWPDGIAVLMSLLAICWTMCGYDASFHLSEECTNAATASPNSIILTAVLGSVLGFFLNLVIAYTIVDVPAAMASDLGQPWAAYLAQVVPQPLVLCILTMTIVCSYFMGQACMVTASRVAL